MRNKEAEKHKVGDWVQFKATVKRGKTHDAEGACTRTLDRIEQKQFCLGQIVGATSVYEGKVESTTYPDGDGSYLTDTQRHFVWLVRRGLTNKSLMVLSADLLTVDMEALAPGIRLPLQYQKHEPLSDANKKCMRKDAQNAPRESNGRFKKERL